MILKKYLERALVAAFFLGSLSPQVQAQVSTEAGASGGTGDGLLIGGHLFYYSDTQSVGGETLKDGSSTFTRFDIQFNMQDYFVGVGGFYEMDSFGDTQADTIMGLVLEGVVGSFFIKILPGFIEQKFTDRSFTTRNGSFFGYELGIRGELYQGFVFYEVALHNRTQTITQEDGSDISDEFVKSETMPMLGFGVKI